jgi:hypothetical protein
VDKVLSLIVAIAIIAFGVWIVVGETLASAPFGWILMGLLPIFVGVASLYDGAQEA